MNIREFYRADPRRQSSVEVPFGDGWTDHRDSHSTYRLNWVADTGEIYAVREPHPGGIFARYLDQLDVEQVDISALRVEILAVAERGMIDAALAGWPAVMSEHDSLRWARDQLAALPTSSPAAP
ncbi:conserved hypothetical protein [Frankia sp. AiPs1]|uniref:hypothetical protein n=1 Tax=Frankia sp. AiPa1 TaxID=573492 RepID=UPI00202B561B|nr:hypothetical protein [Frankia sp. AiPa1]MCL9758345.1 hypothetical protein [Frankia sp. AiPa1]